MILFGLLETPKYSHSYNQFSKLKRRLETKLNNLPVKLLFLMIKNYNIVK